MAGFHSSATGVVLSLEFTVGSEMSRVMLLSLLTVSGGEVYAAATHARLGLIQAPRYRLERSPPRIAADGAGQHTAVAPSHFREDPFLHEWSWPSNVRLPDPG